MPKEAVMTARYSIYTYPQTAKSKSHQSKDISGRVAIDF